MLALVTDSTCGLTRVEADELGVTVLPMTYSVDGVRYSEAPVGENGDYGSLISAGSRVETEAVHPSAFERVFRERLAAGDDVLCVDAVERRENEGVGADLIFHILKRAAQGHELGDDDSKVGKAGLVGGVDYVEVDALAVGDDAVAPQALRALAAGYDAQLAALGCDEAGRKIGADCAEADDGDSGNLFHFTLPKNFFLHYNPARPRAQ